PRRGKRPKPCSKNFRETQSPLDRQYRKKQQSAWDTCKEIPMRNQSHQTMRAVAIDGFGGIEKMKQRELPVPEVANDEILIRVDTAGVGAWDPFEREGGFAEEYGMQPYFPHVLGWDGAGTVEEVGDEVHTLKRGDRVYGVNYLSLKGGFYA